MDRSRVLESLAVAALRGFAVAFGALGANAVFWALHWPHLGG